MERMAIWALTKLMQRVMPSTSDLDDIAMIMKNDTSLPYKKVATGRDTLLFVAGLQVKDWMIYKLPLYTKDSAE